MSGWKSGPYNISFGVGGATPKPPQPAAPVPADAAAARHWQAQGDLRRLSGDVAGADRAYAEQMRATAADPATRAAAGLLCDGRLVEADAAVRAILARRPDDPVALWIAADIASRTGRNGEAEAMLARAVAVAPGFTPARYAYAMVLYWRFRTVEAAAQAQRLLEADPASPMFLHLRATTALQLGDEPAALGAYETVLAAHPDQPLTWMSYGHALKTVGRLAEAIAAYRRSLDLAPGLGEAWWSLANLKTVQLDDGDAARMQAALERTDLPEVDRLQLFFALGKAHEDAGRDAESFRAYEQGCALQRRRVAYDADETTAQMRRTKAVASRAFFAAHAGQGCPAPDPIFVVGLPRSGSTLVEQILASHSLVEGTHELPHIEAIAARLAGPARRPTEGAYPDILAALSPAELKALGEEYLALAATHRKLGRPHFIDKLPNNFAHVALIQLILPNAKIIDARRHPLGCCFSGFKQHFAIGQAFTYDQGDIGRYYRDYVELMAHFDAVLPGRVHRVIYETMVADPEGETRRLLDYCGLPFEEACLRFYENSRPVRTASSEQVRRPIFTDAADHWRRFEPWLGPMKTALGPVLAAYPDVPAL